MSGTPLPRDRFGGAAWIALGASIVGASWRMDRFESMGGTLYTAPGLVPGLYGALMMLLGAALLLRAPRPAAAEAGDDGRLLNGRVAGALLLMLVYAAGLIGRVPFGVATAVFVAAFCAWFNTDAPPRRRYATAAALGLGTALVVVLVFERVFLVRLP